MPYRNYSGGAFFLAKKYALVVALPLSPFDFKFFKSKGGIPMKKINLRDYYPFYKEDFFIEVEDQIAELLKVFDIQEASYQRYIRRYKAYYSLDVDNGIENSILLTAQTPDEIYERKLTKEQLYRGLNSIPKKQADRIYAHYFLGMSKSEIAKSEQVDERAVRESIERGLKNMAKFLKKVL